MAGRHGIAAADLAHRLAFIALTRSQGDGSPPGLRVRPEPPTRLMAPARVSVREGALTSIVRHIRYSASSAEPDGPGQDVCRPRLRVVIGRGHRLGRAGHRAAIHRSVVSDSALRADRWTVDGAVFGRDGRRAAPYVQWLTTSAAHAEQTATRAKAAAADYESAFAMVVPPPVIATNRSLLAANVVGQNTMAIAANEADYAEM